MTTTFRRVPAILTLLGALCTSCGQGERSSPSSTTGPVATASQLATSPMASERPSSTAVVTPPPSASTSAIADSTPTEGAIAKLLADAKVHPEAYDGKPIKTEGLYLGEKKRDRGPFLTGAYTSKIVVDVIVGDAKDDLEHVVYCEMLTFVPPPGLEKLDTIVVEGRGYLDMPNPKHPVRDVVIGNCKLTKKVP